ncbi:MAG: hypothetical protein ABSA12_01680 [Verrucomicrobiia bacterium]|jgi:hypothetical protein
MGHPNNLPFSGLFALPHGREPSTAVTVRILRKHGEPFLFLPPESRLAVQALALYPAQTSRARWARSLLRAALHAPVRLPLEQARYDVSLADPFVQFICRSAGARTGEYPPVAILAGNAAPAGRRFMLLAFSPDGEPVTVIKAGVNPAAQHLVEQEEAFLNSVPEKCRGWVPIPRATFRSESVRAIALEFFPGNSPRGEVREQLAGILGSWLGVTGAVTLGEIPAWQRLRGCRVSYPFVEDLSPHTVVPAMTHGDFAPWNIKVSPRDGRWTVLDWERADRIGVPGWDWFHYEIQSAILVDKCSTSTVQRRIDQLLSSASFRSYATQARIQEVCCPLVAAYLLYSVEIARPTEGLPALRDLLAAQLTLLTRGSRSRATG